jgi:hypothetical protein
MNDAVMHELTVAPETCAGTITMREIDHFENRLMLKTLQEGLKHKVASVDITPNLVHGMCALRSVECHRVGLGFWVPVKCLPERRGRRCAHT